MIKHVCTICVQFVCIIEKKNNIVCLYAELIDKIQTW